MLHLLRDRYLPYDAHRAWDLATGETVSYETADDSTPGAVDPDLASLVEVLAHGQEGRPRRVEDAVSSRKEALHRAQQAAVAGEAQGYVPIAVPLYLRLRAMLEDALVDRSLLLIARPGGTEFDAHCALQHAASRSPRPHVLYIVRDESAPAAVREARSAYGLSTRRGAPTVVDADVERHLRRAERASAFVREGRHMAAERLLRDVSGALHRRGQPVHVAGTQIELGRLLLERGRAADAAGAFQVAGRAAESAGHPERMTDARIWHAAAATDLGRLSEAEALVRAVLEGLSHASEQTALASATLARVLLWQGRVSEASRLNLEWPDAAVDAADDGRFFAGAVRVRVLLALGRIFDAGSAARVLLTGAATAGPLAGIFAASAHLRVLLAAGDLTLAAATLDDLAAACRAARSPLRAVRGRLLMVEGLLRAGRSADARRSLDRLHRLRAAAPPLLRQAVDRAREAAAGRHELHLSAPDPAAALDAARLIAAADEDDDEALSVKRVLTLVAGGIGCCRVDVCSADAGPTTTVLSLGTGMATHLGARAIEAGIPIGPETVMQGYELGVPLRRRLRIVAALVARWPADREPPTGAREWLETAAAVITPAVQAMLSASREATAAATAIPELVGAGAAMVELRAAVARAAAAPFAVLVEGESGVGKELVARAIHQMSVRRERRFCDVNCAALPEDLLESELFGHARGAFTGAVSERPGLFEDADGGTIFLDELADLSARAQAKLLRVLQQHEVRRVGETFSRKVDVRLITAANRDMRAEADAGRFRHDLLYRLDVIRIRIPPLRERAGDVPVLAQHFWRRAAARVGTTAVLTHGVLAALARYHWPGNVRELQNVIAALSVSAPSRGHVRAQLLPAAIAGATTIRSARLADARAEFERRAIDSALARAGGSRSAAARELGLSRQGLLKMITRLGLGPTAVDRISRGAGEPDAAAPYGDGAGKRETA